MITEDIEQGAVEATPEEQAMLEDAVDVALDMIHGDQAGDQIANMVLQAQDITEGLGQAVATVLVGVEKKLGGVPDDMKLALAEEIADELVELAITAGAVAEDEVTDGFVDALVSHAYSQYLTVKEQMGELDPNELQASVADAEQLMGGQPQQRPQGLMGA